MELLAQTACNLLKKGEPFVMATIFSHSGSTPRSSGSKMIVTANGRGIGTIGGGLLEARSMSRAVELIGLGQSEVFPFDLSHEVVTTMDMICGGQAEVLLDCVMPTDDNRAVFRRWRGLLAEKGSGALLTLVITAGEQIQRVTHGILTTEGEIEGEFPLSDMDRDRLTAMVTPRKVCTVTVGCGFVVVEPLEQMCTAHLFGAGHVAQATARVAAMVGFRISVADDRAEYANRERFPDAEAIRVLQTFKNSFSNMTIDRDDYVVILTRGHLHDRTVLAEALKTRAGYIGMIGSRRKRDAIYGVLLQEGFSRTDLDRVHSPIGLSIGAETPEEIAVSIVAEMIRHRAESLMHKP